MKRMDEKESLLSKMKKAKSFLENKESEKKILHPQNIELSTSEVSQAVKTTQEPLEVLFSARGTLYRKEDKEWIELFPGQVQAKSLNEKELQIFFVLDNTRIALNLRVLDRSHIKISSNTIIFTGIEEKQKIFTGCVKLKAEEAAQEIEKKLKKKMSPPGIEPGTSSV